MKKITRDKPAILRRHDAALLAQHLEEVLQQVKARSFEKKDLLTADEFSAIVDRVLQKVTVSRS